MYPDFLKRMLEKEYLAERSILTPTNEYFHKINSHVLSSVPGKEYTYLSADSIGPESSEYHSCVVFYDREFLNKHEESGMASHKLTLKVGVLIMLLRNLSNTDGLCNGTRLIVTRLGDTVIEAEILTGPGCGNRVFMPRILMTTPETSLPFILHRRQFPVRICYAMTINKSQGQSLPNVGVYLEEPVFSNDQLYVAISRTTRRQGLKILIKKNGKETDGDESYQNMLLRQFPDRKTCKKRKIDDEDNEADLFYQKWSKATIPEEKTKVIIKTMQHYGQKMMPWMVEIRQAYKSQQGADRDQHAFLKASSDAMESMEELDYPENALIL
ncbi:ATP-dependent DNA helicase PIF1-like [Papaver somniferum]|uniref:ATP-dependent DNA helicase PIF1-like n=1 Tax=Papaver somniferum TaxID=3469 RepID=UPI000E704E17|nr:ATP-dependent DNA helicase PIF1-like [Papaver somniferum]